MNFFDRAYEGDPPWDIGEAQPEFARRCDLGEITGRVLDIGCGTGENALYFARHGCRTLGVDFAPNAIRRAQRKIVGSQLPIEFRVGNALALSLGRQRFDTVTDCGLFHVFEDGHRPVYAQSVRSVLRPGGRLFLLCFSEREPTDWGGPRRVSESELRSTFSVGWRVRSIEPARFRTTMEAVTGRAWMGTFERVAGRPPHRAARRRSSSSTGRRRAPG
jgi:cyclopropane fatty-acyl-phospholipid synthase-like methyltransferase